MKKSLTSGCVNRYDDVAAETPVATPARSAAVQLGGGSAAAMRGPASDAATAHSPAVNLCATRAVMMTPLFSNSSAR
ncbi:Uncharacterised protein [Mycobacteroides abscessus subsp. abscessus]|nr:Uncharacterised protein [Mycobacteroides abscessus subsp. abscessus]